MSEKILLSPPVFGGNEEKYVQDAFTLPHISTYGKYISQLENSLEAFTGGYPVAGTNSGTSALHLAMRLLNIQSGDEVFCQSFTFCATANPICYQGAIPVFVDSEKETWNMCPDLLEEAIADRIKHGKRPKAIIVVDLYGMPAKFDEILQVAGRFEIPVVEDAAEALGSKYKGQYCSSFGQFGVISFNGNKIITTGSGGCLVSKDVEALAKAKYLAHQAKDNVHFYRHLDIGHNYSINNLSAAVGVAQLESLQQKINKRRRVFDRYVELFSEIEGISFLDEPVWAESNRWLSTITIDPKLAGFDHEALRVSLAEKNIESRYLWNPLHLQPVFRHCSFFGDGVSERLFEKGLCLPSGDNLTQNDQRRIFEVAKALYRR